jgi:large subunit ribosomal protein L33
MPAKAKGKENRVIVTLACTQCKERNYTTEKSRRPKQGKAAVERLELKKYCKRERVHTLHRETR